MVKEEVVCELNLCVEDMVVGLSERLSALLIRQIPISGCGEPELQLHGG